MTSQLNVDTIVDKAGTGGSSVKMANTSTYVGEGGSGTQNTVQGLSKAWIAGDNSTGNIAITDSLNYSSALDVATGKTTVSFTTNMATAKGYSLAGANADASDQTAYQYQSQPLQDGSVATGSIALVHSYVTSNASGMGDYAYWSYSIHGDLA
mgnify:CR=1 FL=1